MEEHWRWGNQAPRARYSWAPPPLLDAQPPAVSRERQIQAEIA
jgi:hypothetical protein